MNSNYKQPPVEMDEPIVGITKLALAHLHLVQGFNPMTWQEFVAGIDQNDCLIGERALLEKDFAKRHFIPYLLIKGKRPANDCTGVLTTFFHYQRGKGVGESRLAGNDSCGMGGHVDAADAFTRSGRLFIHKVPEPASIDIRTTLEFAAGRERDEELEGETSPLKFVGLLIDDSNEVGQVHIGVVMVADATQEPAAYRCKEEQLNELGFFTAEESLARPKLENWSHILMTHARANPDFWVGQ